MQWYGLLFHINNGSFGDFEQSALAACGDGIMIIWNSLCHIPLPLCANYAHATDFSRIQLTLTDKFFGIFTLNPMVLVLF